MLRVVEVVLILLTPTLAGAALLGALRMWGTVDRRTRTRRGHGTRAGTSAAIPLERLAADLRRLHHQVIRLEDTSDMAPGRANRIRAMRAAYGDSLLAACRALDVPDAPEDATRLTTPEVYRLEAALRERGLDVRPTALH